VKIHLNFDEPESSSARNTVRVTETVGLLSGARMVKRGENHDEDVETREERDARVEEMLVRARRAHRPVAKRKKAERKTSPEKKQKG
jgi:hypothetical protein